jgi:ferritin-like protein
MPTSEGLHEDESHLDAAAIDRHRALASIGEELEAVDWYDQRAEATNDAELAEVLAHNRDEEKEHAAMTLEWLRRHDPVLDRHLRTYLFTNDSVVAEEHDAEHGNGESGSSTGEHSGAAQDVSPDVDQGDGSLGIGGLR